MQSLDVRKLNTEKKYSGDLLFEFEGEQDLIDIPYVSFSSPIKAELHYEILEDDSVEITGKVTFSLKGLCSRCLKETECEVIGEADGYFVPRGGKMEAEDYTYANGMIDLREFLRDTVLFSMPANLICSETCRAPDYKEE